MRIHYQKNLNSPDKIISDVLYIGIVDGNTPANVILKSGRELAIRLDRIEAILDDSMPTTDAAPIEQGKWIDDMDCSICGYSEIVYPTCHSKYCPSCGTKMEGTE